VDTLVQRQFSFKTRMAYSHFRTGKIEKIHLMIPCWWVVHKPYLISNPPHRFLFWFGLVLFLHISQSRYMLSSKYQDILVFFSTTYIMQGPNENYKHQSWGRIYFQWGWQSTGSGCPERLWRLLLWKYSRPIWMCICATCYREPALAGELDSMISWGPFQTLQFCDSVIVAVHFFTIRTFWTLHGEKCRNLFLCKLSLLSVFPDGWVGITN